MCLSQRRFDNDVKHEIKLHLQVGVCPRRLDKLSELKATAGSRLFWSVVFPAKYVAATSIIFWYGKGNSPEILCGVSRRLPGCPLYILINAADVQNLFIIVRPHDVHFCPIRVCLNAPQIVIVRASAPPEMPPVLMLFNETCVLSCPFAGFSLQNFCCQRGVGFDTTSYLKYSSL